MGDQTDLTEKFEQFDEETQREIDLAKAAASKRGTLEIHGNQAMASGIATTLDELLEITKTDLGVWKVDHHSVGQHQMGAMPRTVGSSGNWKRDSTEPIIVPLFAIKAWLTRIAPEPVLFPEIRPVEISLPAPPPRRAPDRGGVRLCMAIPDIQTGFRRDMRTGQLDPFHSRRSLDVALQVALELQPDVVVFHGDDVDLPDFSDKYVRSPEMYFTAQASIVEAAWWKAQFRHACPGAEMHAIEGNHEARFMRAIITHNVASYGLRAADELGGPPALSIERLCGLEKLNIQYHGPYPEGEVWIGEKFRFIHGEVVRGQSGKTVAKVAEDLRASEAQGHIHRVELASKTYWKKEGSRTYVAASFGCMCRIDPGVVPGAKYHQNWQNGFGLVEFEEGGEYLYNVHPVHIFDGCAVLNGRRWTGRAEADIVAEVERDTDFKVS